MNLAVEYVRMDQLVPMVDNPRRNDKAIPKVMKSIQRFGWTNPILVRREDKVIIAGHTRLAAAQQLGLDSVPVIWLDMDPVTSRLYSLADNQLATVSEWDEPILANMLRGLMGEDGGLEDLGIAGFDSDELDRLLNAGRLPDEGLTDPDDAPEPPKDVYVQRGQLYQLGVHLLLCGDSTVAADVDRLMQGDLAHLCWTDPPWNIAYDGEASRGRPSKAGRLIANDNLGEDFPQFLALVFAEVRRVVRPGALLYVAMSTSEMATLDATLRALEFHWSSTVIWAKDLFNVSRKDYHPQYEPIWYGWSEGAARLVPLADRKQSDVWEIPRPKRSDEHPDHEAGRAHHARTKQFEPPRRHRVRAVQRVRIHNHRVGADRPCLPSHRTGAGVRPGGHRTMGELHRPEGVTRDDS